MPITRRNFVNAGAAASILGVIPRGSLIGQFIRREATTVDEGAAMPTDFTRMKTIALKAIDSAKSAGATFADVRVSRSVTQAISTTGLRADVSDRERYGLGVRAFIDGCWGFSSSPYWEDIECTELAKSAVTLAKANARVGPRTFDWAPAPAVTGEWTSRGSDPFAITIEEKVDFMNGWELYKADAYHKDFQFTPGIGSVHFDREDWFFASTEGTAIAQTLYTAKGYYNVFIRYRDTTLDLENGPGRAEAFHVHRQRGGWEVIRNAKYPEQVPEMMERAIKSMGIRSAPFDIGRFDVVFDAASTANIVAKTIGIATQLDRALGYEANAGGTSYLGPDPYAYLGADLITSPLINIAGNRSLPWGLSTVKWDHDGVSSGDFPIVQNGVLVDYQTTREQAGWIKNWYSRQNRPIQSHGCAWSPSAGDVPMQHVPNLIMAPGKTNDTFDSLIAGVKKGVAIMGANAQLDFQAKNGIIVQPYMREIINGKLGNALVKGGILFNSSELWKNVTALGGPASENPFEGTSTKGQPSQSCLFSISAVPMAVKDVSIIDINRRA